MVDDNWVKFVNFCAKESDAKRLMQFFDLFLTHEERQSIATRLCIVEALLAGKLTQREIAEQYKVSIAKITRGSNELKRLTEKQRQVLEDLL